ncbi:hypothetical protein GCM10027168_44700 [Streptomyces capparidis]
MVLTTAHLNHTPEDVRDSNLLAACQLCHLRIDYGHHRVTRSFTLAARAAATGQLGLFADADLVRVELPTPPPLSRPATRSAGGRSAPFPRPRRTGGPPLMARIRIWIDPLHADGTVCTHQVKPSGAPRDPASGCTGRRAYQVQCSEHGPVGGPHGLRVLAEPAQAEHRREHAAARVR